jgi:hypothetical protein
MVGPYLPEDVLLKSPLNELSRAKTTEFDLDTAFDWIGSAIKNYEDNINMFTKVLNTRVSSSLRSIVKDFGQRYDKIGNPSMKDVAPAFKFEYENIPLKNKDSSAKTLQYSRMVRDIQNFRDVFVVEFFNDKAFAIVSHDKKRVGKTKTVNSAKELAEEIVKLYSKVYN